MTLLEHLSYTKTVAMTIENPALRIELVNALEKITTKTAAIVEEEAQATIRGVLRDEQLRIPRQVAGASAKKKAQASVDQAFIYLDKRALEEEIEEEEEEEEEATHSQLDLQL